MCESTKRRKEQRVTMNQTSTILAIHYYFRSSITKIHTLEYPKRLFHKFQSSYAKFFALTEVCAKIDVTNCKARDSTVLGSYPKPRLLRLNSNSSARMRRCLDESIRLYFKGVFTNGARQIGFYVNFTASRIT